LPGVGLEKRSRRNVEQHCETWSLNSAEFSDELGSCGSFSDG